MTTSTQRGATSTQRAAFSSISRGSVLAFAAVMLVGAGATGSLQRYWLVVIAGGLALTLGWAARTVHAIALGHDVHPLARLAAMPMLVFAIVMGLLVSVIAIVDPQMIGLEQHLRPGQLTTRVDPAREVAP